MKAIETKYKGYHFRSRLEARWAVFFDVLGIQYQYEAEGYDLGDGIWYLPDFYLSERDGYVEIKGSLDSEQEIKETALKMFLLVEQSQKWGLILVGDIWPGEYKSYWFAYKRCFCPDCKRGYHIFIQSHTEAFSTVDTPNNLKTAYQKARGFRFE